MPKASFNIVIIGSGNMAHALCKLFHKKHNIRQIISRNILTGKALSKKYKTVFSKNINEIDLKADFYFLCIPDKQLSKISKKIKSTSGIIIHHSGSQPISVLGNKASLAVIYPFVSINENTSLNSKTFFITSNHKANLFLINSLLNSVSIKPVYLSDANRLKLHLAGVFANNFVNHLLLLCDDLVPNNEQKKLIFDLAVQATQNFKNNLSEKNQTGPARRNDKNTIQVHLKFLQSRPALKKIYQSITKSIQNKYNHER